MLGGVAKSVKFVYSDEAWGITEWRADLFTNCRVSLAPLAVWDSLSASDLEGIPLVLFSLAEQWVYENAETIRAEAAKIIEEKLFIFSDGRRGTLLRPLSRNSVFVPA